MSLTVGKRITLGFGAVITCIALLGIFSFIKFGTAADKTTDLGASSETAINVTRVESLMRRNVVLLLKHVLSSNAQEMSKLEEDIKGNREANTDLLKKVEAAINTADEKRMYGDVETARDKFWPAMEKCLIPSRDNKQKEAVEIFHNEVEPAYDAYVNAMGALRESQTKQSDSARADGTAAANSGKQAVAIAVPVAGILGIVIAFVTIRSLTKLLSSIAGSLGMGASQLASAAGQVSGSSQAIAQGASEQAASLEETTSALEEISSMTQRNADTAQEANTISGESQKSAEQGNGAMEKMSAAIKEIEKSAAETSKILKVIDEIAFQTNLLALNAAVEAARAGEAGKGFAVVAEEVRNLAMRSAEAAKNTAHLIEESVKNATNGVAIAGEVAGVLEEITKSSSRSCSLVGEIAAASKEQSQGIGQVNTAVSQMDKVVQANAAAAEESASAAEELSSQAEQVKQIVDQLLVLVRGKSAAETAPAGAGLMAAAKQKGKAKKIAALTRKVIPLDGDEAVAKKDAVFEAFSG